MLTQIMKIVRICLLTFVFSHTVIADDQKTLSEKTLEAAFTWNEKGFRVGEAEQCMNWTRTVLAQACGDKFLTLHSKQPWDVHLLDKNETVLPLHADSLASEEFGKKISKLSDVKPGDLIFLKNTYGNWKEGVITHVGIATGNGMYIHRMTSNKGIVKEQEINEQEFAGALRLDEALCK